MVKGTLGSGRRADPHSAIPLERTRPLAGTRGGQGSPAAAPRRVAGAAQGHRRAGRRGAGGGRGGRRGGGAPAWKPDGGCQPAASRIASPPAALGGASWAGSRGLLAAWALASRSCTPSTWTPPSASLPSARSSGDRGGRGVHHPRAAPGQHRGRQVRARRRAARGRGGRQGAAVGVTLGQARRSPPTEQRFPHGERPPVNNPQPAPGGHDQSNAEPRKSSWSPTATASPARPVMAGGRVQPQPTRHPRQGGHHAG